MNCVSRRPHHTECTVKLCVMSEEFQFYQRLFIVAQAKVKCLCVSNIYERKEEEEDEKKQRNVNVVCVHKELNRFWGTIKRVL